MDLTHTEVPALKNELIDHIVQEMERTEISQGEVGRRIDLQRENVNKILRKRKVASLDQLIRMANSIGLSVALKISRIKRNG